MKKLKILLILTTSLIMSLIMFSCDEIPQNGIITKKWNEEYKEYETSVKRRHKVGEITTWKTIKYNNYDGEDFGITVKYTTLKKQKEYSKKYYLTKDLKK
jgi:hypothetical protein